MPLSRALGRCLAAALVVLCSHGAAAQSRPAKPRNKASPVATTRPALWIDLSPALDGPLRSEGIFDEGQWITPPSGRTFLTIPFRYDPREFTALSRAGIRGKGISPYGIRLLAAGRDGALDLQQPQDQTLYEKMEIKAPEAGSRDTAPGTLTGFNQSPPRATAGEKPNAAKASASKRETVSASGSAAVVVEIPRDARQINLDLLGGGSEIIDLAFLDRAREKLSDRIEQARAEAGGEEEAEFASPPDELQRTIIQIQEATPAMSALAIGFLGRSRPLWPVNAPATWATEADGAVLAAAARRQRSLAAPLWAYFSETIMPDGRPLACLPGVREALAEADDDAKSAWLELVAAPPAHGGGALRGEDQPVSGAAPPPALQAAVAFLGAILKTRSPALARRAVDLLVNLDLRGADGSLLAGCSPEAQKVLADRADTVEDADRVRLLLRILLQSPTADTASRIARAAGRCGLRICSPDDPVFARWTSLTMAAERAPFLTALAGADLCPVIHSAPLYEIIRAAAESRGNEAEELAFREAAWSLLLRHGCGNGSAAPPFPMIVSRTARDPLVLGLADAARRGSQARRVQAMLALLRRGYPEEVQRAILESIKSDSARELLLRRLLADRATGRDCKLALLGHLLRPECAGSVPSILQALDELASAVTEKERWQCHAAVKAGLNFIELNQLCLGAADPAKEKLLQWMYALGHLSPQDRVRLAAASSAAQRAAVLEELDLRRGKLVDGDYGVVAVIEMISPLASCEVAGEGTNTESRVVWGPPVRESLRLPSLHFESVDEPEDSGEAVYQVKWRERVIGQGTVLRKARPIGGPAKFSPALQSADARELADGLAAGPPPSGDPIGPLMLPARPLPDKPIPGRLTLDLTDYLREGLKQSEAFEDSDDLVPEKYRISLNYASFGSYYGCGPSMDASRSPARRLTNVMLVLEKIE